MLFHLKAQSRDKQNSLPGSCTAVGRAPSLATQASPQACLMRDEAAAFSHVQEREREREHALGQSHPSLLLYCVDYNESVSPTQTQRERTACGCKCRRQGSLGVTLESAYHDFLEMIGAGLSPHINTGAISLFHWGQDQTQNPRDSQGWGTSCPRPWIFNPLI